MNASREDIEAMGFRYSHKGCACAGSPSVYLMERRNECYELTVYDRRKRPVWKLVCRKMVIARGFVEDLQTKLNEIWDL